MSQKQYDDKSETLTILKLTLEKLLFYVKILN